jgi:Tol biopolymer transport system component
VEREIMPQLAWIISYHGLRWSRDGRYIFVRGTDRKGREGLYKVNAQTGETDPVVYAETGGGVQEAPVCSPNGDTLYYVRWEDQAGVRIMARNLSAGSEREVFRKPGAAISPFAMSPDGTRLAFVDNEHPRSEHKVLMVIPSEGGEPRVLVRAPKIAGFIGLIWTPDGEQLLFPKRGEDKTELWRVSVENGEPEFVNAVPASVRGLRISPDGRQLAYTAGDVKSEVWVLENFLHGLTAKK